MDERLVSGESLMNDGTAIVVFVLMLKARSEFVLNWQKVETTNIIV